MRLLQVALLLAEQAVDAPAHFPRLALLGSPPFLRVRVGARWDWGPSFLQPMPRALRWRPRVLGAAVFRDPEEQRPQAVAQTHVVGGRGTSPLSVSESDQTPDPD